MTQQWIYFVPDPLKFVTKLGRRDMSNYSHVEEYRTSCMDMMKPLFNDAIFEGLAVGVRERYRGEINDCRKLIAILYTICNDINKFKKLYEHDIGVKLCMDPKTSKLN